MSKQFVRTNLFNKNNKKLMPISISSCTSGDAMSSTKSETSSSEVAMVLSRIAVLGNVSP